MALLQQQMKLYIEDIFGFKKVSEYAGKQLSGVIQVLIELRREAKAKKAFVTSDRIRSELAQLDILLKDEKDGNMTYQFE